MKMFEGYYIVENIGVVLVERRFKFKDFKVWGYDFYFGMIDGREVYFVLKVGIREEGEIYMEGGKEYYISEIQKEILKNVRFLVRIVIEKGQFYLEFWFDIEDGNFLLVKEDLRFIFYCFWIEKKFNQFEKYVGSVGLMMDFFKDRVFVKSIFFFYEEYLLKVRRVLREVRDVYRDLMGFGRFVFQYFGEEDKIYQYCFWWFLLMIYFFDVEVFNEVDKIFVMFD